MSYIDIEQVKLQDTQGGNINPVEDETVQLLRRLLHIAQSLTVTDSAQRQRVVVDSGSVNTSTVITSMPGVAQSGTWNINNLASLSSITFGGDSRFQVVDWARQAYNTGIRANLINS